MGVAPTGRYLPGKGVALSLKFHIDQALKG